MSPTGKLTVLAGALLLAASAFAKAPASAPAGTTASCKDGSYSSAATKSGACSGHGGVKKWYGATSGSGAADEGKSSAKSSKSRKEKESAQSDSAATAKPEKPAKAAKANMPAASVATAAPAAAAATGTCKDGSTTSATPKSGACSGHGGVKEWYAAPAAPSAPAAPAAPSAPAAPAAPASKVAYSPPVAAAAGGGHGKVWVNKDTKVYHCQGDKWYGKTREGAYMTEANAVAQGYHADHGKACQP